jgi:segregation and condensation protein A
MRYEVAHDVYEGPLALLVELVKLNLVDVFLLHVQSLTRDYLDRLTDGAGEMTRLNEMAEPLPLFGHLLVLKARGLLPQPPPPEEDEEAPIGLEELQRRLSEYEQFKTVAQLLAHLHALQRDRLTHPRGDALDGAPEATQPQGPLEVGVTDLMSAFAKVLQHAPAPLYEVRAEPWTVERAVSDLRMLLAVKRRLRFLELFTPQKSKVELVVIFLALLELMRQRQALAVQEELFGDIMITWTSDAS